MGVWNIEGENACGVCVKVSWNLVVIFLLSTNSVSTPSRELSVWVGMERREEGVAEDEEEDGFS
jgi:hypothetical protein